MRLSWSHALRPLSKLQPRATVTTEVARGGTRFHAHWVRAGRFGASGAGVQGLGSLRAVGPKLPPVPGQASSPSVCAEPWREVTISSNPTIECPRHCAVLSYSQCVTVRPTLKESEPQEVGVNGSPVRACPPQATMCR